VILVAWLALATVSATGSGLERAYPLYAKGEFKQALEVLERAAHETSSEAELGNVHLLRALCLSALQRRAEVELALREALTHDPLATLDPDEVHPSLVSALNDLKARLRGELHVTADEATAVLAVDGVRVGVGAYQGQTTIGRHRLTATRPDGGAIAALEVLVRPGRTTDVLLGMTPTVREAPAPPPAIAAPAVVPPVVERPRARIEIALGWSASFISGEVSSPDAAVTYQGWSLDRAGGSVRFWPHRTFGLFGAAERQAFALYPPDGAPQKLALWSGKLGPCVRWALGPVGVLVGLGYRFFQTPFLTDATAVAASHQGGALDVRAEVPLGETVIIGAEAGAWLPFTSQALQEPGFAVGADVVWLPLSLGAWSTGLGVSWRFESQLPTGPRTQQVGVVLRTLYR
jgi:hypothetical protein